MWCASRQNLPRVKAPVVWDPFLQVKTLKDVVDESLPKSTNRNNRSLRHMAPPGVKLDREDVIDLAAMSKSVPGKSPVQVTTVVP